MPTPSPFLRPPVGLMRPEPAAVIPAEAALPGGVMYQIKLDGFRAAAFSLPEGPALQARSGSDLTVHFPELVDALGRLPRGTVLDGEIVAWHDARFSFADLLRTASARARDGVEVRYVAFDLLAMPDGRGGVRDVRGLTLGARWSYLVGLLAAVRPPIELVMATQVRSEALGWFDTLTAVGVEGLVAKPLNGVYGGARWVKVRHSDTVDADVVAIVGPLDRPRALVVQLPDGRTATTTRALNIVQARQVAAASAALVAPNGPQRGGMHPVTGHLVAEVRVIPGRHLVMRFVRVRGE
jgi:ATP-dependent DNA ligase